jgi:hypothetical protein
VGDAREVRGNAVLFDMRLSQFGGVARNQQFTEAARWCRSGSTRKA